MTNTTAELCEPDNPAAWALAQHIADHPVSTIQAAFRYLNTPLTLELRDAPAVVEPPADQTGEVRDQLLHAIDFNYVASLGYSGPEELLAAYNTSRTQPADRAEWDALCRETGRLRREGAQLRDRAERIAAEVERLTADRATALREAAQHLYTALFPAVYNDLGQKAAEGVNRAVSELRRMADETATETPAAEPTAEDIARAHVTSLHLIGEQLATIESWFWEHLADVRDAGARWDEVWPVKEATRHYAEELRATPGQAAADGHTGWECDAGAQLLISATTPGPGALGTHHGTIYACPVHRGAAVDRITGAGYEADPRPAPPGHRWDPWPCGHVTAHGAAALTALTASGARQDGATQ